MALQLNFQRKQLTPIQGVNRTIPLEQILAVQGQNPVATGIDEAGKLIGQALARKAELRRQGEVSAKIAALTGMDTSGQDLSGFPPETIMGIAKLNQEGKPKPLQGGVYQKEGKTYQSFYNDRTGEITNRELGGTPTGKGSGYITPRGIDTESGRPVYSNSKVAGLFFDDGTQFHNQPGKLTLQPLPEAQIEKESSLATLKFALDKIKSSYDPEYVGPIDSRIGKGKQYVEGFATPEATDFYSNVADLRNQIVYLRSGKQINETEYERLLAALPNENLSPTDFSRRLTNTIGMIGQISESRNKALQGSGYRSSQGLNPMAIPTPKLSNPQADIQSLAAQELARRRSKKVTP